MPKAIKPMVSSSVIEAFLQKVHNSFDTMTSIEQGIWREILNHINEATVNGLLEAKTVPTHNEAFLSALRHSNEVFAAFKVHALQQEVAAKLLTPDGQLKSFADFRRDVEPITSHQCGAWLQTEYDTAVIRAHNAADWQTFQQNKDIMPNLRWCPTTAPEPEVAHRAFWLAKLNLPVDDPFWTQHHPGDHWNCKCTLEQNNDPIVRPNGLTPNTTKPNEPNMPNKPIEPKAPQQGLENNPGIDHHTFSDNHPYFPNGCSTCPFNKGFKNKMKTAFRNEKKHCYECSKIDAALPTQQVREKAKALIDDVQTNMVARNKACKFYSFNDDESHALKEQGIQLVSREVFMPDKKVIHAIRDFKAHRGKAVTPDELKYFIDSIHTCSMYVDSQKNNIIFVTRQNGKVQKFVVQPNYKLKANGKTDTVNSFVTAGIIRNCNLNESKYTKIR